MHETFDTPGPVTVAIDVASADIEVTVVEAEKTEIEIDGYDKEETPRVSCDPSPDGGYRVTIEHKQKKFWGIRLFNGGLEIALSVPPGTVIDGAGGAAELDAHGTLAALSFRSGSGDLRFEDVSGDVQLSCASGDIEGRSVGGHFGFKGASGDIELGAVSNGITVRSASGDISVGRLEGTSIITVGSGDIELRHVGPGSVDAKAISGDVHVGVREGLGVWLDVSSRSGDVRSTLDTTRRSDADPDLPQLELTLNTVSGDIDVTRVSAGSR
jgi:putative adhesin